MTLIIIIFGLLAAAAGIVIMVNPDVIFGGIKRNVHKAWVRIFAVVMRLVLGYLLIQLAGESRFPTVIEVLGYVSIAAALILAFMGRRLFLSLMTWAFRVINKHGLAVGLFAFAFGAFLVYAFI